MKRKKRKPIPPRTHEGGYHQADKPIDCFNELGDFNIRDGMDPKPPLIEYAVPRLDKATFEMLRATNPAEAELFLRLNGPSAVG